MTTVIFHNLALYSVLLSSEHSLSFDFCVDLCFPLVIYTTCVNRWEGLNTGSDVDLLLRRRCLATLLHQSYIPQSVVLADCLQFKLFLD